MLDLQKGFLHSHPRTTPHFVNRVLVGHVNMELLQAGLLFQDMFNIKTKLARSEETLGKQAHVVGDVKHAGRKKPSS